MLCEDSFLGEAGFSIISEIPIIETEMETKAIIRAVGSISDFCTENEIRIPTKPTSVSAAPTALCILRWGNILANRNSGVYSPIFPLPFSFLSFRGFTVNANPMTMKNSRIPSQGIQAGMAGMTVMVSEVEAV